ncbi:DUF5947 family protein [Streptomyces sp. TS71-3]|uniref:DUF5947 family protein n=1 Tax=Streptomyces sp. TS71-3 TaxID=2733862 RepID=UPI001AFF3BAA|nr:DUF5947 family protein [Streptomyces sp. TS71-3]GHJ42555.1 hypothetical protein Sm713_81640 [Streptomyces sp. TS71-3]
MTPPARLAAPALRDLARRPLPDPPPAQERCDVCAQEVPAEHRHLLDPAADAILCACQACALLFTVEDASARTEEHVPAGRAVGEPAPVPAAAPTDRAVDGTTEREPAGSGGRTSGRVVHGPRYRLIPRRRLRLPDTAVDDLGWAALRVPVSLAFFVPAVPPGQGATVGHPGPLGVTRSAVDPETWARVTARHPVLATLAPGTEALLVDRSRDRREHWIVPLDDCYRLVAVLRTQWKGFTGGAEAQEHVRRFLAGLDPSVPDDRAPGTVRRGLEGEGKGHD